MSKRSALALLVFALITVSVGVIALVITGEPGDSDKPSASDDSGTVVLSLTLQDGNLEWYRVKPLSDDVCTNLPLTDEDPDQMYEVIVKDAGGQIVGTTPTVTTGGKYGEFGCEIPVVLTVKESDFYEVSISGGPFPVSKTIKGGSGDRVQGIIKLY